LADWFIPANDDSVSALRLLLQSFETAITQGQKRYQEREAAKAAKQMAKLSVRRKIVSNAKKG
jgi:ribosomal protein S2